MLQHTHPLITIPSCPARSSEALGLFCQHTRFHTLLPTPQSPFAHLSRVQEVRIEKAIPLLRHLAQSRRNYVTFASVAILFSAVSINCYNFFLEPPVLALDLCHKAKKKLCPFFPLQSFPLQSI